MFLSLFILHFLQEREYALRSFKSGNTPILVATGVAVGIVFLYADDQLVEIDEYKGYLFWKIWLQVACVVLLLHIEPMNWKRLHLINIFIFQKY